jgi:uncharacterized 2Fe-2S/4Fe-4S cluster protein (DUF4445 family)
LLIDAARKVGIEIKSICGGKAKCGKCRVKVNGNFVNKVTRSEKKLLSNDDIKNGYRLACCTKIFGNTEVYIPWSTLATKQRLQIAGEETKVEISPIIKKFKLKIPKISYTNKGIKIIETSHRTTPEPFLSKGIAGFEKIKDKLLKKFNVYIEKIDSEALKKISEIISNKKGEITVIVRNKEIIYVGLEEEITKLYGIAIDLGTTKIAIYLMDLETGKTIDAIGIMNPQITYGEDVISRLRYALESKDGSNRLKKIVLEKINKKINNICKKNKILPEKIMEAVIVGNTAMHHLFLGLPTKQLALSPFKPATNEEIQIKARKLGLTINRCGYVYFPSPIAGFVGSDHLAMIISSKIFEKEGNILRIDIGTNTEISLKTGDMITCCSTASGPAFEGANIKHGMRASQGAIDSVVIEKDTLNVMISTIDNYPPIGICGSGIIDCIAEMLKTEIIDSSGKIIGRKNGVRKGTDGKLEYILTKKGVNKESGIEDNKEVVKGSRKEVGKEIEKKHEKEVGKENQKENVNEDEKTDYITVNQHDIREIQLAKGAIRAGVDILIENANLSVKDIDKIVIAGAFGTYIDISSCMEIGMFPNIPINRFHQIGNAAGIGAKHFLISKKVREEAKELLKNIKYIELTTYSDFAKYFTNAMRFK